MIVNVPSCADVKITKVVVPSTSPVTTFPDAFHTPFPLSLNPIFVFVKLPVVLAFATFTSPAKFPILSIPTIITIAMIKAVTLFHIFFLIVSSIPPLYRGTTSV